MKIDPMLISRYSYSSFSDLIPHEVWPHRSSHTRFPLNFHTDTRVHNPLLHRRLIQRGRHRMFSRSKHG